MIRNYEDPCHPLPWPQTSESLEEHHFHKWVSAELNWSFWLEGKWMYFQYRGLAMLCTDAIIPPIWALS